MAEDGTILSRSHSDFRTDAIRAALANAGLQATPGANEWVVTWPMSEEIRYQLASSTLYITLEPSTLHPITSLVGQAGISRVVIGSLDPVPEYSGKGAAALQAAGIAVSHFTELADECDAVIQDYAVIANGKLQRMAREHLEIFGRPLGMLHCSVIDSDIVKAFSKQGSVIGAKASEDFIPTIRNDGTFELAPPPDLVWVGEQKIGMALEESSEYYPEEDDDALDDESSPITWYGQADAAIASFPRPGDGPPDDDSVAGRLFGLRWLATHGRNLPAGVERILVLDSSDLKDLPLSNDDPNLDLSFDVETFWAGKNRKPTRIILRRGEDRMAQSLAQNAAAAAMKAAEAAALAVTAILPADVARATEMAIECQKTAQASADVVLKELRATSEVRRKLEAKGVIIDSIEGKEPIDVMKHLGSMHGVHSVIWRAGCWGERGVRMILAGAFQRLSAHVTVPATGGQFWQMMVAENAVQSACGPRTKVKVFSSEKNMNLEHCDKGDEDCVHMQNGHPIRYVRLDCRVSLMDDERAREFIEEKDAPVRENAMSEDGQWFL